WYPYDDAYADYCTVNWGLSNDTLVPADYDGDGKAEVSVFRPDDVTWYILNQDCPPSTPAPSPDFQAIPFGYSTDRPVPGDYDGDGRYDVAVFRPENQTWYILQSLRGFLAVTFGLSTDIPVPGDYDGDGKFDIAIFRPEGAIWAILRSSDRQTEIKQFGGSTDTPVPALYIP
ncbi:MAG TPA: VCBS repeat-containing protein, partial [Thermoanaerobaculia bacterium]|nr:VCBS repeat-containing protein [Thermoanaerobaculia bacterium]